MFCMFPSVWQWRNTLSSRHSPPQHNVQANRRAAPMFAELKTRTGPSG